MQRGKTAHMVDVSVGADDGADFQIVAAQDFEDAIDFVARIDHDGIAGCRIAQNRAVALKHSHGKDGVDQLGGRLSAVCGHSQGV